jgi:tRNA G37 N-methylase Trm5
MLGTIPQIDYDRLWLEQMKGFDHGEGTADYWNRRSRTFHSSCQNSTYAEDLVSRMELRPEYSVLDVGCGCGAVAIPLARRVNWVTALDISPIRLEKLSHKAEAAGLTNIAILNRDWNQVTVGEEIDKHDIVLLSRTIPVRLSDTLRKIDLAAKSACYITWRAEQTDEFETEVAEALGRNPPVFPDYLVIYMMLKNMGISTEIETFETTNQECYYSLEGAALGMVKGAEINERQFVRLLAIARNHLTEIDDHYFSTRKIKWVLISWKN